MADECRALITAIDKDAAETCEHELASEAIGVIMDLYPARDLNNPGAFLEYAVMSLCGMPVDVVVKMAHPSFGIARECKFLPSIAEMVTWCEREVAARKLARGKAAARLHQLARREELDKGPIIDKPAKSSGWVKLGKQEAAE